MARTAPRKVSFLNRLKSTIGCGVRSSTTTNTANSTAADASRIRMVGDDQPASLPSMRPQTMRARPPLKVTMPPKSRFFADKSRDSSINLNVAPIRMAHAGMFTRNTHRQPMVEVMTPPTIGPIASAMPRLAPQNAKARVRSAPLKALPMIASDAVSRSAPPTPCTPRATFSSVDVVARPQPTDATANTRRPMTIAFLRP